MQGWMQPRSRKRRRRKEEAALRRAGSGQGTAGLTGPGPAKPGLEESGELQAEPTSSPSRHPQERAGAAPLPAGRGAADVAKYVKE